MSTPSTPPAAGTPDAQKLAPGTPVTVGGRIVRPAVVLVTCCTSLFISSMNAALINVALPVIRAGQCFLWPRFLWPRFLQQPSFWLAAELRCRLGKPVFWMRFWRLP